MIKIEDRQTVEIEVFEDLTQMSDFINDQFDGEEQALKVEVYEKDDYTHTFYMIPFNDEDTMIIIRDNVEYVKNCDRISEAMSEYFDKDEITSFRVFTNYRWELIIKEGVSK